MERALIVKEINELRVFLNRGNKLANTATELSFKIEQIGVSGYRLFASVTGQSEMHRIILLERERSKNWYSCGYTIFKNLENNKSIISDYFKIYVKGIILKFIK